MLPDWITMLPSAFIMMGGALPLLLAQGRIRAVLVLLLPIATLLHLWYLPASSAQVAFPVAGFDLYLFYVHPYTYCFATIFTIAAFAGGIFSLANPAKYRRIEIASAYFYAGSAIGVTFSGDLFSFYIYWELMMVGSLLVIWSGGTEKAWKSGLRYAAIHTLGGIMLLAGIAAYTGISSDISFKAFDIDTSLLLDIATMDRYTVAMWLILAGVLINAAAPPFSAWLPDAYPEASPSGAVFLSAFTTKTAVFTLLVMFPGLTLLLYIGLFMIFYGIVMAMLENDIRRILSYSIINQVGFMVTAIGIGGEMALQGAAMHAFCHILYKSLLFMSAGSVIYQVGKHKCTELGGLVQSMPLTAMCGIVGAMAISAFPLTSGFVSKSIITAAVVNEHMVTVWYLLVAASAGVFLHAGIKFPWFVFFHKDAGIKASDPPLPMRIAMIVSAILCILPALPGLSERGIYLLLPSKVAYTPYTLEHVVSQLQLLLFSALAFFLLLPLLQRTDTITLDFDWFYRRAALRFWQAMVYLYDKLFIPVDSSLVKAFKRRWEYFEANHGPGPGPLVSKNQGIGQTVLWVLALLGIYLVLYYVAKMHVPMVPG